jgi:hypothetical protein
MNKFIKGDRVKLVDFDFEGFDADKKLHVMPYGSEGIVTSVQVKRSQFDRAELTIDFGEFGVHTGIYDYTVRKTKGVENFDDRDRIKATYEEWVDQITEVCDWKTNITMDEVQGKYSEIALQYALNILTSIKVSENPALDVENKILEIDNILNGN